MEQMVPEDHFLRKVDRAVDFSFIYDLCAPLYCADNGRPPSTRRYCFGCCWWGICTGSSPRRGWRKRSTTTSPTSGFAAGSDRQGAGRDDDQPEPSPTFSGTTTLRKRSSTRFCGSAWRRGWWAERSCIRFDAHQGEGEQAQEEAGGSSGHAEGISERTGRAA